MKRICSLILLGMLLCVGVEAAVPGAVDDLIRQNRLDQAEDVIADYVAKHPNDRHARFEYAKILAWNGDTKEAIRQVTMLRKDEPANGDYAVLEARARSWDGQHDVASALIIDTVFKNPNHVDARRAAISILNAAGRHDDAALVRDAAVKKFPNEDFPEAGAEIAPGAKAVLDAESPFSLVEAGFRYSTLSDGYDDWTEYYAAASMDLDGGHVLRLRASLLGRFNDTDTAFDGSYSLPASAWTLTGSFGISPTNNFMPNWEAGLAAGRPLPNDFAVELAYRTADYDGSRFESVSATGEIYAPGYRDAYTLTFAKIGSSGIVTSHRLSTMAFYGPEDESRIEVFGSYGDEAEDSGIRTDVRTVTSLGLTGRHRSFDTVGFSWSLIRTRVERAYTRLETGIGIYWHY